MSEQKNRDADDGARVGPAETSSMPANLAPPAHVIEAASFSPGAFLADRCLEAAGLALALASAACIVVALGMGWQAAALICGIFAFCTVVPIAVRFWRERQFRNTMVSLLENTADVRHVPPLAPHAPTLETALAEDLVVGALARAEKENQALRNANNEYRTYVEQWIHEAKTPIAAAKLVLASMHGESAAALKGEIERIESQVVQALYVARSTSVENDYAIREEVLLELAKDAVKENARLLVGRGVSVSFDVDADLRVLADRQWVRFMLSQVVVNAAKYDAAAIAFRAWEEDAGTPQGRVLVEVRDDGCGIPAADVPRVFERGFTGQVGRAHGSSTGMGLYLVGLMAGKLGMGVMLASEEGAGTRVVFAFPCDRRRLGAQNV
ncbi:sensor histidine kinase [Xiamenia xianingshaonis]|uniref:histidine kinase n=1 Tax=Xiamenia xianingshaonis TaxID=2682776 RepID=A0A9E6SUH4_9ACTN|nr:sensor histidine kinase [Xiamenia xianingshaonis]NHM13402.1 sensor histidine kinase [Xiamenia xianingshaonis]QTU84520.1 sensor histidine kinase [Xiamenia xianingshaonis]